MEMTTALVLLSSLALTGYLANKLIDRKYGTKPNQALEDRIHQIEAFNRDRANISEKIQFDMSRLEARLDARDKKVEGADSRIDIIDASIKSILDEIEKISKRVDSSEISKAFSLNKKEVKHL